MVLSKERLLLLGSEVAGVALPDAGESRAGDLVAAEGLVDADENAGLLWLVSKSPSTSE